MSLQTSKDNYIAAERLYFEIDETFKQHQVEEVNPGEIDFSIDQTILKIKRMNRFLEKINVDDLKPKYDDKFIENINHNIKFFKEAGIFIEKTLISEKYYDDLLSGVSMYIKRMSIPEYMYKPWAKNESELSKKFTRVLLKNYETFESHINRMIVGTMSDNEFKKIYENNKDKMLRIEPLKKKKDSTKFQSFEEFKKENEPEL